MLIAVLEGLIRLAIFIGYVAAISLMPDIKRVYMYHGAVSYTHLDVYKRQFRNRKK